MESTTTPQDLAAMRALIEEHESILAEMGARVSDLHLEHAKLAEEEKALREGRETFLSERVTSLRARQARNASAMLQAVRIYKLNLEIEASLIKEYDDAAREHSAALLAMKAAKAALKGKRNAVSRR